MESPDWYSRLPADLPLPSTNLELEHQSLAARSAPLPPSFNAHVTTSPYSSSQNAIAQHSHSSSAYRTSNHDCDETTFSRTMERNDHGRLNQIQDLRVVSSNHPSNDGPHHTAVEQDSFADSSAAPSTPSDHYDENAENIDPNSPERQDQPHHHPGSAHSRPTNILCDSQTYPVSFTVAVPKSRRVPEKAEEIVAPVPLPYSARSKEALSAMISPVQPAGHPKPVQSQPHVPHEPCIDAVVPTSSESSILPVSETITNFSSNASHGLHYDYSPEMAQHTIANVPRRTHIRPISPSTLMALTEPCLMAWCLEYPMPKPLPPVSYRAYGYGY
ncbi:hypothetical protein B0H11DRAFT_1280101 [Mycena galericulata]|nr:hypothetical protein B0H11DRAFT_1280101 [Mycena galericulata]